MTEKKRDLQEMVPIRLQDLVGKLSLIGFQDHVIRTRKVRDQDLSTVLGIYRENFSGESEQRIRKYSSTFRKTFYVIDDPQGKVLAYCVYYVRLRINGRRLKKVATLLSFAVADRAKGQGLGNILLEESINDLGINSISVVRLFVEVENEPAIALYKKHGFQITDELSDICGHGARCYEMVLNIDKKRTTDNTGLIS